MSEFGGVRTADAIRRESEREVWVSPEIHSCPDKGVLFGQVWIRGRTHATLSASLSELPLQTNWYYWLWYVCGSCRERNDDTHSSLSKNSTEKSEAWLSIAPLLPNMISPNNYYRNHQSSIYGFFNFRTEDRKKKTKFFGFLTFCFYLDK